MSEEISQRNESDTATNLASNLNHRRRKNRTKRNNDSIEFSVRDLEMIAALQKNNNDSNNISKLQEHMTYFPTIKMGKKAGDFSTPFKVKLTNYSMSSPFGSADREDKYKSHNLSHRSSVESFENEFGTIPILQRQAISVPRKELPRKTSKGQLSSSKLPEMPDAISSKLGELNYISTMKHKDSNFKLKLMLNRIERLKYEERRANK